MKAVAAVLLTVAVLASAEVFEGNTDLDYAQVLFVRAIGYTDGRWKFDVTVRHADAGWDHYADLWQIMDPENGKILGERILAHPHDNEQPFTRSSVPVAIDPQITEVLIRAKCTQHDFGGQEILVSLEPGKDDHTSVTVDR